ncbi:MAG: cobalt-precorrin-5B (C(1))-methyltransferase, partial [Rhodospirillales bacterium]|nr:cobalt-precorrin-5B (C(1))-methyltransferase [Rhodospirillales bacterium]
MTDGSSSSGALRRGWTTGACAAAATRAAYTALVTGRFPDPVSVTLPGGQEPSFPLVVAERGSDHGRAGVRKDAGDDPDVTHGALVESWVRPAPAGAGVVFRAGEGVGIVTKPGLSLAVGEPAINPAPRKMIAEMLDDLAPALGGPSDVSVAIAIPDGRRLARQTMNGRLGIVGGLSVLGTSGIVKPYSCAAWIASIRQGIDVAAAAGAPHLAAATGRISEQAAQALYGLDESALIDMGDFAGATLKLIRRK